MINMRPLMAGLALAMMTSTTALAADQFDLVCKGIQTSETTHTKKPYAVTLSVDLKSYRWCFRSDGCTGVAPVIGYNADRITLVLANDSPIHVDRTLNRVSGEMLGEMKIDMPDGSARYVTDISTCIAQPFTPFPKAKF